MSKRLAKGLNAEVWKEPEMKTATVKICGAECEAPVWWVLWVEWLARCPRDLVTAHRLQIELGADPRGLSTTSDYWKARHG